jgi:hypothetical protein
MQITIRSEDYMRKLCVSVGRENMVLTPRYGGMIERNSDPVRTPAQEDNLKEWTTMRNVLASGEVWVGPTDRMVADYWALITTMNGRAVIRRIKSKESMSRRIMLLNRIKLKYEQGIYSGDFVVMKSTQQHAKHSWPLVFKSGVLHAITNHIEWINIAADQLGYYYAQNNTTFQSWLQRNIEFPPYASQTERDKITHRMQLIFHLRQLNSKRLWKKYINTHKCRFGYMTYSKGKAKMWQHAHNDLIRVRHDLTDERSPEMKRQLMIRGWLGE